MLSRLCSLGMLYYRLSDVHQWQNTCFMVLHSLDTGMEVRSGLNSCLSVLTSCTHSSLTLIDLRSNASKCNPANVLTLDMATYAIPVANTLLDRSTMAQSYDNP